MGKILKMKVHNNRQLKELQKEFNTIFPYLKIEFFKNPHKEGIGSDEREILNSNLKVGDARDKSTIGLMPILGNMSVGAFEKTFEEMFGLFVQVYRKSHGKWLQTWVTDVWTLEEQNNRGKVLGDIDNLMIN